MIRQAILELYCEELEERHTWEISEEGLPRPTLVKPSENRPEDDAPAPADYADDPGESPF